MTSRFYASGILWVLLFAVSFMVWALTSCATASPLLPDCRQLLADSYQAQVARNNAQIAEQNAQRAVMAGDAAATQLDYVPLPGAVKAEVRRRWAAEVTAPDGKPVYVAK